ncbi:MAG: metallophosphoesterase [Myxococcota bacterium]
MWGPADAAGEASLQRSAPIVRTTISPRNEVHEVVLGPLEPGRAYRYHVEVGPWQSQEWIIRGPSDAEPLKIAWTADNQIGWQTFRGMLPAIAASKPDFIVLAGDIVQHGEMLREWQTEWFSTLAVADFGQTTPVYFARGNHDGEHALSYAFTTLPGNEAWYAFTRANVRFIVLDTEAENGVVPEQLAWLEAELASPASKDADFRVVSFHKTPFSNRWSNAKSTYDGEDWVRDNWVPEFKRLGVDLVVAGHTHAYQRIDKDGVRYVTVGGAGGRIDTYRTGHWPLDKDILVHHWAMMEIGDRRIHWVARDEGGKVIDEFTLRARRR